MSVIDTHISYLENSKRLALMRIRSIAKKIVPDAQEVISYGMPTLTYKGTAFLGFNAHTKHIGIYPYGQEEIELFKNELENLNYTFSSGAIRIPFASQIPEDLLKKIIKHRIERIMNKKL